jgi:alpha-amylase
MSRHGSSFPESRVRRAAGIAGILLVLASCGASSSPSPTTSPSAVLASATPSAVAGAPACEPVSGGGSAASPGPWWRDRTFYEVFVRSFADSDGDGIGDLRGLTERLDYLNDGDPATTDDLGVTGIWLMPIAESPSYHGYDVTDYEAIEPDYGTAADFAALMAAAHDRGIQVIVDLVLNHTSIEHPWFVDARTPGSDHDDWYVWSTEPPPFAGPGGQRVWHKDGDRWYYAYFWEGMPDLNLENPDVTAVLDGIARFWLEDMGVDGFRLDAARHLIEDGDELANTDATFAWLAGFRERIKAAYPDALVLGEVFDATSMSSRYVRDGALDLTFDFGLAGATITAIRSGDAASVRAAQEEVAEAYPPDGLAAFLTNHDQNRVANQLDGDVAALKLAASLLLTGPGVPFVYYGEEIGMTGHKPDELIRTPMRWDDSAGAGFTTGTPWEPLSEDPPERNVETERADTESLLSSYRTLIALRAAHPALAHGSWTPLAASDPAVAASLRQAGGETLVVVANLGETALSGVGLSLDAGPLCGTPTAESLLGPADVAAPTITATGGLDGYVPVALGARETLVVRLAP